jgi:hypothetical protein
VAATSATSPAGGLPLGGLSLAPVTTPGSQSTFMLTGLGNLTSTIGNAFKKIDWGAVVCWMT